MKWFKGGTLFRCGLVCLVFGSLGLWINADHFKGATTATSKFKRTTGKIIASNVRSYRRKRRLFWGKETVYYFDIRYRYAANGQTFSSRRISFDIPESDRDSAASQAVVRRYPEGKTVAVFYLPNQPSLSVVELRNGQTKTVFFTNAVLWMVGLALVLGAFLKTQIRKRKTKKLS